MIVTTIIEDPRNRLRIVTPDTNAGRQRSRLGRMDSKVTYDLVGVRGGVTHMKWTGKFDGRDYPVQGVDYVLTNAYSRIDDHSYQTTIKIDGVLTATAKVVISPDPKTLTTSTTGNNAQGRSALQPRFMNGNSHRINLFV